MIEMILFGSTMFLIMVAFAFIVKGQYEIVFVLGIVIIFLGMGLTAVDKSNNNETICQVLGFDSYGYFNGFVCYKELGYIKGTNEMRYCTMSIDVNQTAKEWCE